MLHAVGYYGPASAAPAAFARLSAGLDEAIVRIITARPGLQPVVETMEALTPTLIRSLAMTPSSWITPKAAKGVDSAIAGRGLVATEAIGKNEVVAVKGGHIVSTASAPLAQ